MLHYSLSLATVLSLVAATSCAPPLSEVTIGHDTFKYIQLVGKAFFPSDARDKFGDTAGGWGSAIAADVKSWKKKKDGSYEGILFAVPDRGWNTNGTVDYQARVHKFQMDFKPYYGSTPVPLSEDQLIWKYLDSTLLYDYRGVATTGLDADYIIPAAGGFPDLPAGKAQDGTLKLAMDCEGLILNKDGSYWISDEYGPNAYHFSKTGKLLKVINPPAAFIPMRNGVKSYSADSPPVFDPTAIPVPANPNTGRQNNQGFEGMTISPDGEHLFLLLQSAAIQDTGSPIASTRRNTRLLKWSFEKKKFTGEWVVQLPLYLDKNVTKVAAQSEMHYLDENKFMVLARDSSKGFGQTDSKSIYRHIDIIDISKATNIVGTAYDTPSDPVAPLGVLKAGIKPAAYYPFIDYSDNAQLSRFGLINGGPLNGPGLLNEKWESIALLPTFRKKNEYFLLSVNDNDFVTQNGFLNFGQTTYKDASGLNYNTQALIFLVELDD